MSPRPAPESVRRPHQIGVPLRSGWIKSPKLTAAFGVTAALGLGACGWAGHARLADGESTDAALPTATATLDSIEQAGYESLSGEGDAAIERVEYQSPDEVPAPPDEEAVSPEEAVGASYLDMGEEVSSEERSSPPPVPEGETEVTETVVVPEEPARTVVEPEAIVPVDSAASEIVDGEAAAIEPAPEEALPTGEAVPELPENSRLRDIADGVAQGTDGQVELQPVGPSAPEKPAVPIPTADLCRKYSPRSIGEVRLSVAPNSMGALPTDKGDPASSCFPQGSELAGTDTWYETTCYGKYLFICHDPLYFEDQVAERYGEHCGKWVQPAVSAGKFFGAVPMAPYRFFANTLSDEPYSQDKYGQTRNGFADGTFIPPFHTGAAALTAGTVTGLFFLIP